MTDREEATEHAGAPTRPHATVPPRSKLRRFGPVALGLAAHVVLRRLLAGWLHLSTSDAKIALAMVIIAAPMVFAFIMLIRALPGE